MKKIKEYVEEMEAELIEFTQTLVRTKSYSGAEGAAVKCVEAKMQELGYDEVKTDSMGNVVGRIGSGEVTIMFDSHIDTVEADASDWDYDPFGGDIVDGKLYGRGSVDMKSGAAASIYAGAIAKRTGLAEGKTIYVSCTVLEEDCDGENLKHLFKEFGIQPDYMVICEPSGNKIVTGHKGKAQIAITTHGVSAHGSAPEKGINAINEMAEIIDRVGQTNERLMQSENSGTVVISRITSQSASLNAVPYECEVYLDRRMVLGETRQTIEDEMNAIVEGKRATWEIGTLYRKSWTGLDVAYDPIHVPWEIDLDHKWAKTCTMAYNEILNTAPEYDYWDFSTNAVTTVDMGIPTIGFGPGEYKLAHMVNEHCHVAQITDACKFYSAIIKSI